jgi:hypothetical protein
MYVVNIISFTIFPFNVIIVSFLPFLLFRHYMTRLLLFIVFLYWMNKNTNVCIDW